MIPFFSVVALTIIDVFRTLANFKDGAFFENNVVFFCKILILKLQNLAYPTRTVPSGGTNI